jgi:putative membrane protein
VTTPVTGPTAGPPTLAAERTALAWTRTGLAVLVNGGLLLVRTLSGRGSMASAALVVLALVVAGVAVVLGRRRGRALRAGHPAARREPCVLGVLVAALCLATVVVVPGLGA